MMYELCNEKYKDMFLIIHSPVAIIKYRED